MTDVFSFDKDCVGHQFYLFWLMNEKKLKYSSLENITSYKYFTGDFLSQLNYSVSLKIAGILS